VEEDTAMLALMEWTERLLEEMDRERETEILDQDGTTLTKETNDQLHRND